MEVVVGLNFRRQAAIQYPRHRLPQYLHWTDSAEFNILLWDQDSGLPGKLISEVTLIDGVMDQTVDLIPVSMCRQLLPHL